MSAQGRRTLRADERLRRLLVMLPWLAERGTVPTAEMAARFGVSVSQLVRDLELAAMCGVPPFVDELIDLIVDEDEVSLGIPRLFTKPLRLTAPEGFALVAAARAALELPGAEPDGALARAVGKLEAAVGAEAVEIELGVPAALDAVTAAVVDGAVLRLRYWAVSTGAQTDRVVEPLQVFSDRGHWYLLVHDRGVDGQRIFRVDRIESVERTGETFQPAGPVAIPLWFDGSPDAVPVRLRLAPDAAWVAERYPVNEVQRHDDGTTEVVLSVVSERWLGRLLVRLGAGAEVLDPAEWRDLGARTASQVLARYG